MLSVFALIAFRGLIDFPCCALTTTWSERIARVVISGQRESQRIPVPPDGWDEEKGRLLEGMNAAWYNTANGDYFWYVKRAVDAYLDSSATTNSANGRSRSLEDGLLGQQLLMLYRVTLDTKYYNGASALRQRLESLCGESSATLGHDKISDRAPEELCKAEPFLAEYAEVFHEQKHFKGITYDFAQWSRRIKQHSATVSGDASHAQPVHEPQLAAAIVDSLPFYPEDDPGRAQLITMLNLIAADVARRLDVKTAMLHEAQGHPAIAGWPDSRSAACLIVYALMKGVRLGYLPSRYSADGHRLWRNTHMSAILTKATSSGRLSDETPGNREAKQAGEALADRRHSVQAGAFLLAATEVDLMPTSTLARGQTVMLDAWYNSQQRINAAGQMDFFHYKWSDFSDSGYSLLGHMFRSVGMATSTLYLAPTREKLRNAQYYLIVSPDIPSKNPSPHYMTESDAGEIAAWVSQGGILMIMENDPANADITHLNLLADRFGIHFKDVLTHQIIGERVEDGRIPVSAGGQSLFRLAHTFYMKDTCSIALKEPAVALVRDRTSIVMAVAKSGRGTVFAAVDPWLYNEYTDGRKNPEIYSQFDNFAGGKELVRWIAEQRPVKVAKAAKR